MTKKKILVVEDDGITAKHIKKTLETLGYSVLGVVAFAEDAVKMAEDLRPDLVLMDIYLKGPMSGIVAAKLIKERHDTSIVYLTASSDQENLKKAMATEHDGFVIKPFDSSLLHAEIKKALYRLECQSEDARPPEGL